MKVFISSTYLDNRERREQVRRAIERAGMVAVGMERFEATDQPTVEDCRQRAIGCNIFVGIVAHRYGWEPEGQPKGEEKSITWLEYEAAREAGLSRLMFELDPRVPHTNDDLDPGPDRWAKQGKLEKFKEEYAKDQRPAVFEELDLQAAVLDSLVKWRERQEGPRVPVVPVEDAGPGDDLEAYRQALEAEHGTLHLAGFQTKLRVPIDLAELYVPLTALPDLRGHGEAAYADGTAAERLLREGHQSEVFLREAFRFAARLKPKRRGLVILGEPGSGKTTHMKRLLLWCLKEGSESLGLEAGLVPVFLPLRRLEDSDRTVHGFIEQQLNACPGVGPGFGKALLSKGKGRMLLLFDGLDEVMDPERRAEIAGWIDKLAEDRPGSVAVVRYDNERQREAVVEPFLLGRYPVTNEQYVRFLKENPGRKEPEYWADRRYNQAQQPVVGVSWDDAVAFAEWAGGWLPTEAEWEYACRAGTTTATYAGNLTSVDEDPVLDGIAWYGGNSGGQTHAVGQKAPNDWALYDMLGNVFEWCSDCSDLAGSYRVFRGGSWGSYAGRVRAALRDWDAPGLRDVSLGFRLARGQGEPAKTGRSPGAAEPP